MAHDGNERFLLIKCDVYPDVARSASLALASIAAERDDPCGLRTALEACGLIEEVDEETS